MELKVADQNSLKWPGSHLKKKKKKKKKEQNNDSD